MATTETKARVKRTAKEHDTKVKSASANSGAKANGAKAEKVLNPCGCHCGGETTNRFLPGHDARLKSRLINLVIEGKTAQERRTAEKELDKLGWTSFLEKSRTSRAAKAEAKAKREAEKREAAKSAPKASSKATAKPASKASAKGKAATKAGKPKRAVKPTAETDEVEPAQGQAVSDSDFEEPDVLRAVADLDEAVAAADNEMDEDDED